MEKRVRETMVDIFVNMFNFASHSLNLLNGCCCGRGESASTYRRFSVEGVGGDLVEYARLERVSVGWWWWSPLFPKTVRSQDCLYLKVGSLSWLYLFFHV